MIIFNFIILFSAWYFLGCCVLSAIDDKDQRLFKWAESCPIPFGFGLVTFCWPIITYFWFKYNK